MGLLQNKTALITGATSGIGYACTVTFAEEGANLIITGRRRQKLLQLEKLLIENYKVKVLSFELDVRRREKVEEVVASLPAKWKEIDILVNNAGLARGFSKVHESNVDDWEEMIDTNVKGLLYVTRQVLPLMVKREKGHIINIGSIAGGEVYLNGNVYCATKSAVNALTKAIRIDILDKKIKVSSIDPGLVETEFSMVRFHGDVERAKKVYENIQPLTADDIADAVLYCVTRPAHVNINEIVLTPLAQASTTYIVRE
jgi:serine 3-dehydrogenase